jgi:hypothetical protein
MIDAGMIDARRRSSLRMLDVRVLCALLLCGLAAACGPRVLDAPVVSDEALKISLRKVMEKGEPRARGNAHPATVSDVRIAHILASLEFRDTKGTRRPVIRSETVYQLAEALNKAVKQATPDDDILAAVFETDRRLGLFTNKKVTAFRMFFRDDLVRLEFYDVERELESSSGSGKVTDRGYEMPLAVPASEGGFRLAAGEGIVVDGARAVQIDWRNEYFAKPLQLGVRAGRFKRRTVLMEEDDLGAGEKTGAPRPAVAQEPPLRLLEGGSPELHDAQRAAFDELQALRRSGLVPEAEYQRRRQLIEKGELEKAGYRPAAKPAPARSEP